MFGAQLEGFVTFSVERAGRVRTTECDPNRTADVRAEHELAGDISLDKKSTRCHKQGMWTEEAPCG